MDNCPYNGKATAEVIKIMTPKELLYLDDALSHVQFLTTQCNNAAAQLQDPTLRLQVQQMAQRHTQIFNTFYNIV